MGRLVGFEPTHIGTTIRGLNRLTTDAISLTFQYYHKNFRNQAQKNSRFRGNFLYLLADSLEHISDSASCQYQLWICRI